MEGLRRGGGGPGACAPGASRGPARGQDAPLAPALGPLTVAAANARVSRRLAHNHVLDAVAAAMRDVLGLRLAVVARPAERDGRLALLAVRDGRSCTRPSARERAAMLVLVRAGWPFVLGTLAPLVVADAERDPPLAGLTARAALGIHGYVAVPVVAADGSCWGILCGMDRHTTAGAVAEAGLVQVVARLLAVQWQRDRAAQERGVRLASTTAQHELNNALGKVYLRAQLLEEPGLPPPVRAASASLQDGVSQLAAALRELRRARPPHGTAGPAL